LSTQLFRIVACLGFFAFALAPALAQTAPKKPKSPGEMAAADRIATEKRDKCLHEAREQKLSFFKRRAYVRECVKR
jgi:hypothetical protein